MGAELQADRDIVLSAIEATASGPGSRPQPHSGLALQFATPELQEDGEVVLAAVRRSGLALQYAAYELQQDPAFKARAVKANPDARHFVVQDLPTMGPASA